MPKRTLIPILSLLLSAACGGLPTLDGLGDMQPAAAPDMVAESVPSGCQASLATVRMTRPQARFVKCWNFSDLAGSNSPSDPWQSSDCTRLGQPSADFGWSIGTVTPKDQLVVNLKNLSSVSETIYCRLSGGSGTSFSVPQTRDSSVSVFLTHTFSGAAGVTSTLSLFSQSLPDRHTDLNLKQPADNQPRQDSVTVAASAKYDTIRFSAARPANMMAQGTWSVAWVLVVTEP